jgi:hypothetical protein
MQHRSFGEARRDSSFEDRIRPVIDVTARLRRLLDPPDPGDPADLPGEAA